MAKALRGHDAKAACASNWHDLTSKRCKMFGLPLSIHTRTLQEFARRCPGSRRAWLVPRSMAKPPCVQHNWFSCRRTNGGPEAVMPRLHVLACSFLLFAMGCQAHQLIPGTPLQVLSCLTKACTWQELAMQYTTKCLDMLISS